MKNKIVKRSLVIIAVSIAVVSLLAGCKFNFDIDTMDKKVGFAETCFNDNWKATFRYYDGSDEKHISLEQGEILELNYSMEIEKGELELYIKDGEGEVLLTAEDMEGELIYKAEDETDCYICISAIEAKGSFELTWEITE